MQILSEIHHNGSFIFMCCLVGGAIGFSAWLTVEVLKTEDSFPAVLVPFAVLLLMCFCGFRIVSNGVPVEYKATITNIEEVTKNGYVIVEQEGQIYTLEKIE